jgi:predicted Zn-dependent protease
MQKLHQDHPADASMTRMLAAVLADAGDYAGSDKLYATLLEKTPDDAALLLGHGQNLIHELRFVDAMKAYTRATELDPANGDGWSGLAFAASRTHQSDVTLHALTMRSKYLPEVASTYFLWATAYDDLHQRGQAATYSPIKNGRHGSVSRSSAASLESGDNSPAIANGYPSFARSNHVYTGSNLKM